MNSVVFVLEQDVLYFSGAVYFASRIILFVDSFFPKTRCVIRLLISLAISE